MSQPVRHLLRYQVILRIVWPTIWMSIGEGNPKFRIWRDDVSRLKEEFNAGKLPWQFLPQPMHVVSGGMMIFALVRRESPRLTYR